MRLIGAHPIVQLLHQHDPATGINLSGKMVLAGLKKAPPTTAQPS
jgi:hypothetical protein